MIVDGVFVRLLFTPEHLHTGEVTTEVFLHPSLDSKNFGNLNRFKPVRSLLGDGTKVKEDYRCEVGNVISSQPLT